MIRNKVIVCLCLFFLIIAGGWMLSKETAKNRNTYRINKSTSDQPMHIRSTNDSDLKDVYPIPFYPREYVKIVNNQHK